MSTIPVHLVREPEGFIRLSARVDNATWQKIASFFVYIDGDQLAEDEDLFDLEGRKFWAIRRGPSTEENAAHVEELLQIPSQYRLNTLDAQAEEERLRSETAQAAFDAGMSLFPHEEGSYIPRSETFDGRLRGVWYKIGNGFDIYGGGEEFCIEDGEAFIWHVQNNGMDGDDWLRNNIQLAGAGGIGLRYNATPARLVFVRSLRPSQPALPPAGNLYRLHVAPHASSLPGGEFLWNASDASGPDRITEHATWVTTEDPHVYVGAGTGNEGRDAVWLAVTTESGFQGLEYAYMYRFALRYPSTPERLAAAQSRLPKWVGTTLRGCYRIPRKGISLASQVADNAADALRAACIWGIPLDTIQFNPEAGIVHAEKSWQVWSDGTITFGELYSVALIHSKSASFEDRWPEFPAPPQDLPPRTLAPAAVELLSVIAQPSARSAWLQKKWQRLLGATSITQRTPHVPPVRGSSGGWSWETRLTRLVVSFQDGSSHTLFLAEKHEGGMVGGEGDTDDSVLLFEDEAKANTWFRENRSEG